MDDAKAAFEDLEKTVNIYISRTRFYIICGLIAGFAAGFFLGRYTL